MCTRIRTTSGSVACRKFMPSVTSAPSSDQSAMNSALDALVIISDEIFLLRNPAPGSCKFRILRPVMSRYNSAKGHTLSMAILCMLFAGFLINNGCQQQIHLFLPIESSAVSHSPSIISFFPLVERVQLAIPSWNCCHLLYHGLRCGVSS